MKLVSLVLAALLFWTWSWYPGLALKVLNPETPEPEYTYESSPQGGPDSYPPYWVTEDYWVAEGCPVETQVKENAEQILAPLDADHIAQVGIVCMPNEGFINAGIWTDRFGTYHGFGEPNGHAREDNGMIFLILYKDNDIEVHYAVGDGLPKITAVELGSIVRQAEGATSVAEAILSITTSFNEVARANYEPFEPEEVAYGGAIAKEDSLSLATILVFVIGLYLLVQPFAFAGHTFGAWSFGNALFWWIYLIVAFAEASGTSSGSSSSSWGSFSSGSSGSGGSGKSLGGGGGIHRSN